MRFRERKESVNYLEEVYRRIFPQDTTAREQAVARLEQLTMPHWALGDLMDLAVDLAGMTRTLRPPVDRKKIVVMVGDHGVTDEGVSRYPREVTAQMVRNFVAGGAGINALARQVGAGVVVADVGTAADLGDLARTGTIISRKIGMGTANMAAGPAMSRTHAVLAVEAGIDIAESLAPDTDIFGTGDMGIGNTTPSSAIAAVMSGLDVSLLTGKGTGLDDRQLQHKITVIQRAIEVNQPDPGDPMDVLAKVGGYEIGAIAGLILGAAAHRKPVVVDGFISTAGALIAYGLEPFVRDYIICSHRSVEPGHRFMHERLGARPLLDLNLRLGEGTGAALAMHLVDAAVRILTEVATFSEAGVTGTPSPP
ncbi:MAG: nicotinate-nucleotide--dimethylbenzimidazole phosphoribosyltransferase [Desulfobulbaceae bacterium]|jgi:nicotinate-nucleotide--dimethylbenzimidazole phosphoribosyltransferase|nr:nicotinate-nucleotide--dimethylbenzimidazole phosphoribosyltransferase [Desulfobulbaceae bacterium]